MRAVAFFLVCVSTLALGACVTNRDVGVLPPPVQPQATAATAVPPPTGAWKFDRRIDRATGKPVGQAFVITRRVTVRSKQPFATAAAGLQLQCFKEKPVVQIVFPYRVGSNRSASLSYRFDDKPPRNAEVRFLPDYKTVVFEERPAVQQFVADLKSAEILFVSINSLVSGATRAEFPVRHAEPAINTGFADCPLPAPRRATASQPDGKPA